MRESKVSERDLALIPQAPKASWLKINSREISKYLKSILKTDDQDADIILGNGAFISNVQRVGQPFGMLYGLGAARDDAGNRLIWPGQGGSGGTHIYAEQDDIIGNPNPEFHALSTPWIPNKAAPRPSM
jgi:hypothetical protein